MEIGRGCVWPSPPSPCSVRYLVSFGVNSTMIDEELVVSKCGHVSVWALSQVSPLLSPSEPMTPTLLVEEPSSLVLSLANSASFAWESIVRVGSHPELHVVCPSDANAKQPASVRRALLRHARWQAGVSSSSGS